MGVYRLNVTSAFPPGSKHGVNVWHYRQATLPVPPAPSLVGAIKNFYTAIAGITPNTMSWTWDGLMTEVGTSTPTAVASMTPWTVAGTVSTDDYGPAGVGIVVGWRSSLATRRGRGRTFISPISRAAWQSDGTIVDSHVATMRTAAAALITASVADGNGAVCVWSPSDNVGRDIIGSKVNDKPAWLSSRRS